MFSVVIRLCKILGVVFKQSFESGFLNKKSDPYFNPGSCPYVFYSKRSDPDSVTLNPDPKHYVKGTALCLILYKINSNSFTF